MANPLSSSLKTLLRSALGHSRICIGIGPVRFYMFYHPHPMHAIKIDIGKYLVVPTTLAVSFIIHSLDM